MPAHRKTAGRRKPARPAAEALERRQLLATITVNTTADDDGTAGTATLSLRQAIEVSNGTLPVASLTPAQASLVVGGPTTPNTIDFAIPGAGPFAISPASALPAITSPTVIDGYSQPGAHPNTNGPGRAKNTIILIELDGAKGPGGSGLDIKAGQITVQGLAIGGFATGNGIFIEDQTGDLIRGDFIGTDATGTKPLPNADGITNTNNTTLYDDSNTIGGTAAGAGNVISGNDGAGLLITGHVVEYVGPRGRTTDLVEGNFIGTDVTGTRPLPNGTAGIVDTGGGSTIGGTAAGAGNVISGNDGAGLVVGGVATSSRDVEVILFPSSDLVQGNLIGTDAAGTGPLPNGRDGILFSNTGGSSTVGGTAAGAANVIADNRGAGVDVNPSSPYVPDPDPAVLISGNSIFANVGLGIDLEGPNRLPPYPVLLAAGFGREDILGLSGTLDAAPSTAFTIEFFANPAPDPSGFGQGRTYLGSTVVHTDAAGHAAIVFFSTLASLRGQYLTATATDPRGNTSEFSRDLPTISMSPTTTILAGSTPLAPLGQLSTFTAIVSTTTASIPTGTVAFAEDGGFLGVATLDASGRAVLVVVGLSLGTHTISATYLGDPSHATSRSNDFAQGVLPTVAFGGPTVTSATALTSHSVGVSFSRPLLVGTAQDVRNYAIIGPDGHAVAIESATFDPSTDSVTLVTRRPLEPRQSYRLTVNGLRIGRVDDVYGIPLEGKPGRPGSSFVGTVTPREPVHAGSHPLGPKKSLHAHVYKAKH